MDADTRSYVRFSFGSCCAVSCLLLLVAMTSDVDAAITASNDTCNVRFKLRSKIDVHHDCEHIDIPGCSTSFKVAYSNFPPYIFEENGTVKGILMEFIDDIIHSCCMGCGTFEFVGPLEGDEIFYVNASIILPVRTAKTNTHYLGDEYYYLAEMPGVTFMKEKELVPPSVITGKMLTAVADTWPLFVIAFVLALGSGVVMWCLDMLFNKNELRMHFPSGILDGFWWAFVSMTTVGYGDVTPKSFLARVFAMLWIFVGITIFAIYTATLTSAVTDAVGNEQETLLGKKVAILNSTTEGRIASLKESAVVVEFGTIEEIIDALHERSVDGVAMDDRITSYFLLDMVQTVPDLHFLKHVTMEGQTYGVAIPPHEHDISILIESFFSHNEDQRDLILSEIMRHYQKVDHTSHVQQHVAMFSIDSPLFTIALYGSAAVIGAGSVIGLVIVFIDHRTKAMKCREKGVESGREVFDRKPDSNWEAEFEEEAKLLWRKWCTKVTAPGL